MWYLEKYLQNPSNFCFWKNMDAKIWLLFFYCRVVCIPTWPSVQSCTILQECVLKRFLWSGLHPLCDHTILHIWKQIFRNNIATSGNLSFYRHDAFIDIISLASFLGEKEEKLCLCNMVQFIHFLCMHRQKKQKIILLINWTVSCIFIQSVKRKRRDSPPTGVIL